MTDAEAVVREVLDTPPPSALRETANPPVVNSSFSTILPALQIAWDSTSLGALKTCPEYYNLSIRLGYTLHGDNPHFVFGLICHSAREMYDRLRAGNLDWRYYRRLRRIGVTRAMAREACGPGLATHNDALICVMRYIFCATWNFEKRRPWHSDEPTKNRETLLRTMVWFLDQFQNDPMETYIRADGAPAVELSFRFDSGIETQTTGETFIFCGHLDKVARFHNRLWVNDMKTTKGALSTEFFDRYTPDNQMSMYSLAGTMVLHEPIAGVMIDGIQVLVTGSRFQRGQVTRTKAQIEEWHLDAAWWLAQAESFALANHWPQNDKSCDKFGGCQFRMVCGASPEVRPTLLKNHYARRVWDPLQTREA